MGSARIGFNWKDETNYEAMLKVGDGHMDVNGDGLSDSITFGIWQPTDGSMEVMTFVRLASAEEGSIDWSVDLTYKNKFSVSDFPVGWTFSDAKFEDAKLKLTGRGSNSEEKVKEIPWAELDPTRNHYHEEPILNPPSDALPEEVTFEEAKGFEYESWYGSGYVLPTKEELDSFAEKTEKPE